MSVRKIDLKKGTKFTSFNEFHDIFQEYQEIQRQIFTVNSSIPLSNSMKNLPNEEDLLYKRIRYGCKFGKNRESEATGLRSSRTYKKGCPAFVYLSLTRDKTSIEIKDLNLLHENHEISTEFFEHIPENRTKKLTDSQREHVLNLLELRCKKKFIQNEVLRKFKIFLSSKDLQNLETELKGDDDDNLSNALEILKTHDARSTIILEEVKSNGLEQKMFQGLYFSTPEMRQVMSAWPEMLFVDGTYNLHKRGFVTMIMAVEDSNQYTQIVGMGILANESAATLEGLFRCFDEDHDNACEKIKCIMTDKDMTERRCLLKTFPNALLFLCLFHTLKTFGRTVTKSGMNITTDERNLSLHLLDKMAKSHSEKEYDKFYKQFSEQVPGTVKAYFDKNWHTNRNEWTLYSMNVHGNYGNYTNNRVESINNKVKSVIPPHSTLTDFIKYFFKWYNNRNLNLQHKLVTNILKAPVTSFSEHGVENMYLQCLTEEPFQQVLHELKRCAPMKISNPKHDTLECEIHSRHERLNVTTKTCQCDHWKSLELPCRHIFAARKFFQINLFDEKLCATRWTKAYNVKHQPGLKIPTAQEPYMLTEVKTYMVVTPKPTTVNQRRKLVEPTTSSLLRLCSMTTGETLQRRLDLLKEIENSWRSNIELGVHELNRQADQSSPDQASPDDIDIAHEISNLSLMENSIILPPPIKLRGRPSGAFKCTLGPTSKPRTKK